MVKKYIFSESYHSSLSSEYLYFLLRELPDELSGEYTSVVDQVTNCINFWVDVDPNEETAVY